MPDSPVPDAGVRPARIDDAPAVAAVQAAAWRASYADLLPADVLAELTAESLAPRWDEAIRTTPSPRHHLLVATAGGTVVGFATAAPGGDPDLDPEHDADLLELVVGPTARGAGHGSRLLAAVADVLRGDGFARMHHWVSAADADLRRFLLEAGWGPDGASRELDLRGDGEVVVAQERLHTSLEP